MNTKSFFEYLGIADMERVHSQILAWIFSSNCDSINSKQKNELFQTLFNLDSDSQIVNVQTEYNGIDILIQTNKEVVVIENKIKSSQHSNQLDRYKKLCDVEFSNKSKHYYFITLIGEHTKDSNWIKITYKQIYVHLKTFELLPNKNHSVILDEYLLFLGRLIYVTEDFIKYPLKYDIVFTDGNKRKADKINFEYATENEKFIAFNQLETILQKYFLNILIEKVTSIRGSVSETRGDALVDFIIQEGIIYNNRKYSTMIQLQKHTIKFAFVIGGNGYLKSSKKWIDDILPLMSNLSKDNHSDYKRLNKPKDKAYVSISKNLDLHYWHKDIDELAEFIIAEIENGRQMTNELLKAINLINN